MEGHGLSLLSWQGESPHGQQAQYSFLQQDLSTVILQSLLFAYYTTLVIEMRSPNTHADIRGSVTRIGSCVRVSYASSPCLCVGVPCVGYAADRSTLHPPWNAMGPNVDHTTFVQ